MGGLFHFYCRFYRDSGLPPVGKPVYGDGLNICFSYTFLRFSSLFFAFLRFSSLFLYFSFLFFSFSSLFLYFSYTFLILFFALKSREKEEKRRRKGEEKEKKSGEKPEKSRRKAGEKKSAAPLLVGGAQKSNI